MPVFDETSSAALRSRTTSAPLDPPLPRLGPKAPPPLPPSNTNQLAEGAHHEVVIVGTGPAGMMLNLVLNRAGIRPLAIEQQTSNLLHGHADGIQPRTLEVLQQLGVAAEVFAQGNANHRIAFWNPKKGGGGGGGGGGGRGIERTAVTDDVTVPSRYKHKVLLAAGRVCGILENQAIHYGGNIARGIEFESFTLNKEEEEDHPEWPVRVHLHEPSTGRKFTVLTKYLIGADGAHSKVRDLIGGRMQGESTDYIWGVVDCVVLRSDFPDFRKRCAIHSDAGSIMSIPRERIEGGRWLVRLYTQMEETDGSDRSTARAAREAVTLDGILAQVRRAIAPYKVEIEHVDWWAAYQIGQRVSDKFSLADAAGCERIFIMGDACHTHSPKAGQGMNVSMMDAYNLGWKLSHALLGLAPNPHKHLIPSYAAERRLVAQQLIDFDNAFASKFSQKMGSDGNGNGNGEGLTHDAFFQVFHTGGGFTSGCGIQYPPSALVSAPSSSSSSSSTPPANINLDNGYITPGRRLISIQLLRFCDDAPTQLHDALPNNGQYALVLLLPHSLALETAQKVVGLAGRYADGVVQPVVVHPRRTNDELEWSAFPSVMQSRWWRGVLGDTTGDGYRTLGVEVEVEGEGKGKGKVVVVRPDGVVGGVWSLGEEALESVGAWLDGLLVRVERGEKARL